jgi:hypothetical protein
MTLGIGRIIHDSSVIYVGRISINIFISFIDSRKNKRQLRDHEKKEGELKERRNKKLRFEEISEGEELTNTEEKNMDEIEY